MFDMVRWIRNLGCFGMLVLMVVVAVGVYVVIAPWSFHIGGRVTWNTVWSGVGELRDAQGSRYGLYLSFYPYIHRGMGGSRVGPARPTPAITLRGNAQVCTARGTKYPFNLTGTIYGAWANAEGKEIWLDLREPGASLYMRRHFRLYGAFAGAKLPLDDHKTMFMYLTPDGTLTPARSYTSPVPEKHANVTLAFGNSADFDALCSSFVHRK